jgi:hypothetical protein
MVSETRFTAMSADQWPHDKTGVKAILKVISPAVSLTDGHRLYISEPQAEENQSSTSRIPREVTDKVQDIERGKSSRNAGRSRQILPDEPGPASMPIVRLLSKDELDFQLELDQSGVGVGFPQRALNELRHQIPKEMFDVSELVCATYIDSRLMVLRGVSGSACLFTRSPLDSKAGLLN